MCVYICISVFIISHWGLKQQEDSFKRFVNELSILFLSLSYVCRTNQTLDKHVGDSTDSDNEEKEGRICRDERTIELN